MLPLHALFLICLAPLVRNYDGFAHVTIRIWDDDYHSDCGPEPEDAALLLDLGHCMSPNSPGDDDEYEVYSITGWGRSWGECLKNETDANFYYFDGPVTPTFNCSAGPSDHVNFDSHPNGNVLSAPTGTCFHQGDYYLRFDCHDGFPFNDSSIANASAHYYRTRTPTNSQVRRTDFYSTFDLESNLLWDRPVASQWNDPYRGSAAPNCTQASIATIGANSISPSSSSFEISHCRVEIYGDSPKTILRYVSYDCDDVFLFDDFYGDDDCSPESFTQTFIRRKSQAERDKIPENTFCKDDPPDDDYLTSIEPGECVPGADDEASFILELGLPIVVDVESNRAEIAAMPTKKYLRRERYWGSSCDGFWTTSEIVRQGACVLVPNPEEWPDDYFYMRVFANETLLVGLYYSRPGCHMGSFLWMNVTVLDEGPNSCKMLLDGSMKYVKYVVSDSDEVTHIARTYLAVFPIGNYYECPAEEAVFTALADNITSGPLEGYAIFVHDSFCLSEEGFYLPDGFRSFEATCVEGEMRGRQFTVVDSCQNVFVDVTSNFCSLGYVFRCWPVLCDGVSEWEESVCSGHGVCTDWEKCECIDDYTSWNCSIPPPPESEGNGNGPGNTGAGWLEENPYLFAGLLAGSLSFAMCVVALIACVMITVMTVLSRRLANQKRVLQQFDSLEMDDVEFVKLRAERERENVAKFRVNEGLYEIEWGAIELEKEIGSGGSGATVFLASWDGKPVAVKVFRMSSLTSSMEEFEREVTILGSVGHPSILQFYGCSLKRPRVALVMEYCEFGDLAVYVGRSRRGLHPLLTMQLKTSLLHQISSAMHHLHSRSIIHRDLKCANILLTKEMVPKVMDFGLSRVMSDSKSGQMTTKIGTSHYMAPEVTFGNRYDAKADTFSFGIIMFEMLTENFQPYGKQAASIEARVAVDSSFRPRLPESFLDSSLEWYVDAMKRSWSHEPDLRPSFGELKDLFAEHFRSGLEQRQRGEEAGEKSEDDDDDDDDRSEEEGDGSD